MTKESGTQGVLKKRSIPYKLFLLLLLGVLVCFVVITMGIQFYNKRTITYKADPNSLTKRYEEMRDKPSNFPDKAMYYANLAISAETAGRYAEAIEAFKKREELQKDSMTSSDYVVLARYYCRINNKESAVKTLQYARDLKTTDSSKKQVIDSSIEKINTRGCSEWLRPYDAQ